MLEQDIPIMANLEARPAALFVQSASKFASNIQVKIDNKIVNAKSIMGIISLGILNGQVITIIADGEDEQEAVSDLVKFLNNL